MDSFLDYIKLDDNGATLCAYDQGFVDPDKEGNVVFFLERTTQWDEDSIALTTIQARALFLLLPRSTVSQWYEWKLALGGMTLKYA